MIEKDSIKISPKPFVFITLLFTMFVIIGSSANYFRMKNRFNSLVDHSKLIYNSHKFEIENLITNIAAENTLDSINKPEKGIYYVDVILNINGSWILYDSQASILNKTFVSQKDIDLIQKYISLEDKDKFSFQKELKDVYKNFYKPYPYYNTDFLISILPINQNNNVIGYLVVATSKVQRD